MATVRDWLLTIAEVLSDDQPGREFQRYSLRGLLAAYNDGMCLVAKYRPDLFTELRVVELTGGRHQDVRGCCVNVTDVIEQVDAQGNIIRSLEGTRPTATTAKRNWKKPSCLPRPENGYLISYASIDRNLNGRFTVEPAVPCDIKAYVRVKCVEAPCPLDETQENLQFHGDCIHATAVWHYVLARALSGDNFENGIPQIAQYHYRMFFDILGVVQRQEDALESREEA